MSGKQMKARRVEQFLLYFLYMHTSCVLEGNKKGPAGPVSPRVLFFDQLQVVVFMKSL